MKKIFLIVSLFGTLISAFAQNNNTRVIDDRRDNNTFISGNTFQIQDNRGTTTTTTTGNNPPAAPVNLSRQKAINEYLLSLSGSETLTAMTRTPYADDPLPDIIVNDAGEAFILTSVPKTIKDNDDPIFLTSTVQNIFPGAIVYADQNLADGHPTLVGFSYGTVDLRIDFNNGGTFYLKDVRNDEGSVYSAIYQMLDSTNDQYAPPVNLSSKEETFSSVSKMLWKLGVDASYLENSIKVNTETSHNETKIVKIQDFTQKYYTVSIVPYDDQNLYKYFGEDFTLDEMKRKFSSGKPMAVISSVTFGRRIYGIDEYYSEDFSFKGDESVSVKVAGIGASAKSEHSISRNSMSHETRLQILGGSAEPMKWVNIDSMSVKRALSQEGALKIGPGNQGTVLSFSANYLITRKEITTRATGNYNETSYVKCPKSVRVEVKNEADCLPDCVKFRLFYNVLVVTGDAENGYQYDILTGPEADGEKSWLHSFDYKYSKGKKNAYTIPDSKCLRSFDLGDVTIKNCFIFGPVYYTIRSKTSNASNHWVQNESGYFDLNGDHLSVYLSGSALAGGKGVHIHSKTDPLPRGWYSRNDH